MTQSKAGQSAVAVLGTGKVGHLVCDQLSTLGGYPVTAVDLDLDQARHAVVDVQGEPLPNTNAVAADLSDAASIRQALEGHRYAVSCAPYHLNATIAEVARELGIHYLDLTEDIASTRRIMELAEGADSAFIPQCGLAPGFIGISAHHLAQEFERVDTLRMRVGALPVYPMGRLKYNLTWSTEGLINEYGNPCEALIDGKLVQVRPLEDYEILVIDGEEYEAFNTSGGLGTLAETWAGRINRMDYKTIRYPGHREIMALLMVDLRLNEDRATLRRIFEHALPRTYQDVVLIYVTATGWLNGAYVQRSYARKIYHDELGGREWGAIQITTAAGICAVLDLHAQGHLPSRGFVRQEDVPYEAFIANRFGKVYA